MKHENTTPYERAIDVAYLTLQTEVDKILRYANQCRREGDTQEYTDALKIMIELTEAKAKLAKIRRHIRILEKAIEG